MDKQALGERDICTKLITQAMEEAGCDARTEVREEFPPDPLRATSGGAV